MCEEKIMSKAVLVIDMPEYCYQCICFEVEALGDFCSHMDREIETYEKPDWCPLREVLEK